MIKVQPRRQLPLQHLVPNQNYVWKLANALSNIAGTTKTTCFNHYYVTNMNAVRRWQTAVAATTLHKSGDGPKTPTKNVASGHMKWVPAKRVPAT